MIHMGKLKIQRYILTLYTIAFAIGTATHSYDVYLHGWPVNWSHIPEWINIFWSSLLILDPLVILLLWKKRNLAILLAFLIMISDVSINSYVAYNVTSYGMNMYLVLQGIFLIFLLSSASYVWKKTI